MGGARNRNQPSVARVVAEEPPSEESEEEEKEVVPTPSAAAQAAAMAHKAGKIGTKKLAKIQRKEAQRAARQEEDQRRAKRKEKEKAREEEWERQKAEAEEQRKKQKEEEERIKQEREQRARAELDEWKSYFEVDGEGTLQDDQAEKRKRLASFADYIKKEKIVLIEDLAVNFELNTQEVIDELKRMEKEGRLTGVIDERGKYIYISPEEMESLVRFIQIRGRVSLDEIVAESNRLIKVQQQVQLSPEDEEPLPPEAEGGEDLTNNSNTPQTTNPHLQTPNPSQTVTVST